MNMNEKGNIKKEIIKYKIFIVMIFMSLFGITITSMSHLTKTFSYVQYGEYGKIISFMMALSIELAMLGIAFGIAENRRKKDNYSLFSNIILYIGLVLFFIINFFGNTYHAITIYLKSSKMLESFDLIGIDSLVWGTILITSSVLPILIIILTELFVIFYNKLHTNTELFLKLEEDINNKNTKNRKKKQNKIIDTIKEISKDIKINSNKKEEENKIQNDSINQLNNKNKIFEEIKNEITTQLISSDIDKEKEIVKNKNTKNVIIDVEKKDLKINNGNGKTDDLQLEFNLLDRNYKAIKTGAGKWRLF
jgi:primosomal protein N'